MNISRRLNRRAFTIVELVIVVAVVATLAAVLIPTFTSIVEKAHQNSDIQMIRNASIIIETEKALGANIDDPEAALLLLQEKGISLLELKSDEYKLCWHTAGCCFVLFYSDTELSAYPEGISITECELVTENSFQNGSETPNQTSGDQNSNSEIELPVQTEPEDEPEVETIKYNVNISQDKNVNLLSDLFAEEGNPYTISLSTTNGRNAMRVKISMGDEFVYEEVVANSEFRYELPSVNGEIYIEADGLTNVRTTAKSKNGEYVYQNGYIDNSKVSTNDVSLVSSDGYTATGWIELPWDNIASGDLVIYLYIVDGQIAPVTQTPSAVNSDAGFQYRFYDGIKTDSITDNIKNISEALEINYMYIRLNKDQYYYYEYFRTSVQGLGENLIITFNEPILPNS